MLLPLLLILSLLNSSVWSCNDDNGGSDYERLMERQDAADNYYPSATYNDYQWLPAFYYQNPHRGPESYSSEIVEARSPFGRLRPQVTSQLNKKDEERTEAESRFGLLGFKLGLANMFLNNQFGNSNTGNQPVNPFTSLTNKKNPPFIPNPNFNSILNQFDSCTTPNSEAGICTKSSICSLFGGRPSGSCSFGTVCCVNTVSKCSAVVTLNNTLWQSPITPVNSNSGCGLTIKVDQTLIEQKTRAICQVRLDFVSFSIAQPNAETVCNTDTFTVNGATNKVPIICGDNSGQHMYLNVPGTSATDLQLQFNFGQSTSARFWNIKISMIPCGADYAAPRDCLQYFQGTSGQVSSFNWRDVTGTVTRQLANMDYKVCFRTELVNQRAASALCLTPCTVTNGGTPFSLSTATDGGGNPVVDQSQSIAADCNNDFLVFPNGFDPAVPLIDPTNALDRFCGERFNVGLANAASATVCSKSKAFSFFYKTNGDETTAPTVDGAVGTNVNGNIGYCLNYQQSV